MGQMFVIVLTGLARSGKDSVADYLVKEYGFKKFTFSDVLVEELIKQGREPTKANQAIIGDELRKEKGLDIVARMLFEKFKEEEKVVLVGSRSIEEIAFLKKKAEKFFLVKIEALLQKRFGRKEKGTHKTLKELNERDARDKKNKGMQKVIDAAEFTIKNDSSFENLHKKTDKLMENIYKEKC